MRTEIMSNQKIKKTQSGFRIDFSNTLFDAESINIRNKNIRKIANSKKAALDFSNKCASEGFSIVPF